MSENSMMLTCGLVCISDDPHEDYSFVGMAQANETPYDFTTRLLAFGYTRVAAVPLWQLPYHPKAWQMFLERNQVFEDRTKGESQSG